MNGPEIDQVFEKLREAGHGSVVKLELPDSDGLVEALVFEPGPRRPPGYEDGVFVVVPSEADKVFYLDPEASREKGRLILKVPSMMADKPTVPNLSPDDMLKEYEYLRNEPHIKLGGGTSGDMHSKAKGIIDVG